MLLQCRHSFPHLRTDAQSTLTPSWTLTFTEQLLCASALTVSGDTQMDGLVPKFEELMIKAAQFMETEMSAAKLPGRAP